MMLLLLSLSVLCVGLSAQFPYVEFPQVQFLSVGDRCTLPYGGAGVCSYSLSCPEFAQTGGSYRPFVCSYHYNKPIVCCPEQFITVDQPAKPQVGEKSKQACREHLKVLQNTTLDAGDYPRDALAPQTKAVQPREFPFMAAVGFGKEKKIYWRCSGALVHNRFVLAVGHCVASRRHGAAKWILLGDVDLYGNTDHSNRQLFAIEERFAHSGFKPPSIYDDISLLKLDRNAIYTPHVRPACLNTDPDLLNNVGEVAGWELDDWVIVQGKSQMMKVPLPIVPDQECINAHQVLNGGPRLKNGYNSDMMMCVGGKQGGLDTCERDTGGPYLKRSPEYPAGLHVVAGITLFGKTICGGLNTPSIAVKVSKYIPWIEDTIWP